MSLSRRDFLRLAALSLGLGAAGLPRLSAAEPAVSFLRSTRSSRCIPSCNCAPRPTRIIVANVIVQTLRVDHIGAALAAAGGGDPPRLVSVCQRSSYAHAAGVSGATCASPRYSLHLARCADAHHAVPSPDPANLLTTYPRTVQATAAWQQAQTWGGTGDGGGGRGPRHGADARPRFRRRTRCATTSTHGQIRRTIRMVMAPTSPGSSRAGARPVPMSASRPTCTLISAKIADDQGVAQTSDLLRGLQWVYDNRNGIDGSGPIKVVSLSTPPRSRRAT